MKQYLVKVNTSGETPTATVQERTAIQAVGDTFSTMLKDDEASVGYVKTAVQVGLVYGSALLSKYRTTGQFSYNPWSA